MEMSEDFSDKINRIRSTLFEYLYLFETGPHLIYDNELNKIEWDNSSARVSFDFSGLSTKLPSSPVLLSSFDN